MACPECKGKLVDISDRDHEIYLCEICGELIYGGEL